MHSEERPSTITASDKRAQTNDSVLDLKEFRFVSDNEANGESETKI